MKYTKTILFALLSLIIASVASAGSALAWSWGNYTERTYATVPAGYMANGMIITDASDSHGSIYGPHILHVNGVAFETFSGKPSGFYSLTANGGSGSSEVWLDW